MEARKGRPASLFEKDAKKPRLAAGAASGREDKHDQDLMLHQAKVLLNSTDPEFGGAGSNVPEVLKSVKGDCDYKPQYIAFDMPAYGGLVLEF